MKAITIRVSFYGFSYLEDEWRKQKELKYEMDVS